MNDFREKVWRELNDLTTIQLRAFAWCCGMRALPFLGVQGSFNFWKKKDRQRHLYSCFYALDIAAAYDDARDARAAIDVMAARAAIDIRAIRDAIVARDAIDTRAARAAIDTIAARIARDAAYSAINATTTSFTRDSFKSAILEDIRAIKENKEPSVSIELYGEVWTQFQNALANEDCAYWGKLYQSIFEKNFDLDPEALLQRINVPQEIRERGAAAVGHHLESIEKKGAEKLNEARIIILGDKGAGKTSLAVKLKNPDAEMPKVEDSTAGVDVSHWKPKGEDVNIRIWDFGGHTIIHTVHRFFLSERCAYVVVCDGRTEGNKNLKYWLDFVKDYGDNSAVFILVNIQDEHLPTISINNLKERYNIKGCCAFSIGGDREALSDFCESLKVHIRDNPSWSASVISRDAFQVKEEMEGLFAREDRESITRENFDRIAEKFQADDADELLKNLHALGVCLWYEGMEKFDTLVLNPEWISHGVYQVINWVHEQKKYSLKLEDFIAVFKNNASRFPKEKHEFFFSLMKAYDLAYETEAGGDLIIPHLLKEDRPERLPDFPLAESLMLRYRSDHPLPPDTISRFIVRHNREMMKRKTKEEGYPVWRYGILLEDGSSTALVREVDRTISVSVKGKDRTAYISRLRQTLDEIFDSYKSTNPELEYRVQRFGEIPENVSPLLWLSKNKISNLINRNRTYYDDETGEYIPLHPIKEVYNITINNPGSIILGGREHNINIDQSEHFEFHGCNINIQGNLNDLAQLMSEAGHSEEAAEISNTAKALERVEQSETKEEVKKSGILGRLKRLLADLNDKDSKVYKAASGIKHASAIVRDIASAYASISQWAGLS